MEYRVNDELYYKIFNSSREIESLNKTAFDLMIDLYTDILDEYSIYLEGEITVDLEHKRNTIVYSLLNYLLKIMNTYCMFLCGSHKIGAMILTRTITEIFIKIHYLLAVDNEELYTNYINSSLIAEKFYLKELEGMQAFEKEFVEGTKTSIFNLLNNSNIEDVNTLSRKNTPFPSIEKMCEYLIKENIISNVSYNILYRTTSNYTHANWSAVENEMFRNKTSKVDMRLIAPVSIQIIEMLLFMNSKMKNIKDPFKNKLKIYEDAFIILDKTFIERYWVNK